MGASRGGLPAQRKTKPGQKGRRGRVYPAAGPFAQTRLSPCSLDRNRRTSCLSLPPDHTFTRRLHQKHRFQR